MSECITVREAIPVEHARTLEVQRQQYEDEDGTRHDDAGVSIIGPKGKVYGIVWLNTADFVAFCRQVAEAYGEH